MKHSMNFTNTSDDLDRFSGREDLKRFLEDLQLDGLELMPIMGYDLSYLTPDLFSGIHLYCPTEWMDKDREEVLAHYRKDLDFAKNMGAPYVVFHVTEVSMEESVNYTFRYNDEEVIEAAIGLINQLLDGQEYDFYFLMENLWWPGLTFLDRGLTKKLLDGIHYEKKGFMLDTGHLMNTNQDLKTPQEALDFINSLLDKNEDMIPYIHGMHLCQSLSGEYVRDFKKRPPFPKDDPDAWSEHVYMHIFHVDQHQPFVAPGVDRLVARIAPDYVTYEYITGSRKEYAGKVGTVLSSRCPSPCPGTGGRTAGQKDRP